jgi:hypothetical protein
MDISIYFQKNFIKVPAPGRRLIKEGFFLTMP